MITVDLTPEPEDPKTMLQHQTYMILNEIIQQSIITIELAAKSDHSRLERIVTDAIYLYTDSRKLMDYFVEYGANPIPDEHWGGYQEMQQLFKLSRTDILSQLSEETKSILKSKGIEL